MADTFRPPAGAATAAKRALRWIKEGHAGGGFTDVGRKRASQLAARETLSLETVKRMYSFFSRHEVDKQGKDFNNLSKPSPGRVAWDAWGGDAGYSWAKQIVGSTKEKSSMSADSTIFIPIIGKELQDDGTLLVKGIATDSSIDSEGQICDPTWLDSAMPSWFKWGNIREQHSKIAAGVATEYEKQDGQHLITVKVVDPVSVKKVQEHVLKGFSVGIVNARVTRDEKAAGGRIVDGDIVEVSLVDRPANPVCMLSLAKMVNGVMQPVKELAMTEKAFGEETTGEQTAAEETTAEETKPKKAVEASAPAEESSQKPGEESSQAPGEESSREGGVAGVAGKAEGDCPHCGEALGKMSALIEQMYSKMCGPEENVKSVPVEETAKSQSEDISKAVEKAVEAKFEARVSELEKQVNAPVRMAVGQASNPSDKKDETVAKARVWREKAMSTTDSRLAQGYLALALEAEKSL